MRICLALLMLIVAIAALPKQAPAALVGQHLARLPMLSADSGSGLPQEAQPTAPPPSLGANSFYKKYVSASGIPIVSSALVPDGAFQPVKAIVEKMLAKRPDIRDEMLRNHGIVAIMATTEVTTDIPEHSDLYTAFPGVDWDTRARGLGATLARPATSAAEENLLCYSTDVYRGESILIHEFSHSMLNIGLDSIEPSFRQRLIASHAAAIASGLWSNTYAATNVDEYWAEGVQGWFNANIQSIPANGIHNHVNTRVELLAYDPLLAALIAEVFVADNWTYPCK